MEPSTPEEKSKYNHTGHICPVCGEPLYEKVVNGNNCCCHPYGLRKDAQCKAIYNAVSGIQDAHSARLDPESSPPEQTENKKKLLELLSGLFEGKK